MTLRAGRAAVGTAACLLGLLACAAALSQTALAQEPDLTKRLGAGLKCAYADPAPRLSRNMEMSGASPIELVTALATMVQDARTCRAIRAAAEAELTRLNATEAVVNYRAAILMQQRVDEMMREADLRANAMRFVVGPPPPRLTRLRPAVP